MQQYDIIIIGSGVAGLTAAIYSSRANKSVLILENGVLGGTTSTLENIENYPGFDSISGFDLVQKMTQQVSNLGVTLEFTNIQKIDFENKNIMCDNNLVYSYKALIIASGTSYKKLNIPRENDFKFKGISYCATCDGNLFKNKNVIVVTNGLVGKNSIDYLSNVTSQLIILDTTNQYKSDKYTVHNNVKINELIGDEKLSAIQFECNNEKIELACDGLFVCLGKETDLKLYKNVINTENNYILSDEHMHTNKSGVFVAGDIRKKSLKQIVTACADGAIAGTEAIKYLTNNN